MFDNSNIILSDSHILPTTTIQTLANEGILSMRAFNVCSSLGLHTVQDVFNFVEKGNSFLSITHCGLKTTGELVNLVKMYAGTRPAEIYLNTFPKHFVYLVNEIFDKYRNCHRQEPEDATFGGVFPNAAVFLNRWMNHTNAFVDNISSIIATEEAAYLVLNQALEVACRILDAVEKIEKQQSESWAENFVEIFGEKKSSIEADVNRRFKKISMLKALSKTKKKMLERKYESLKKNSSTIISNYAKSFFPEYASAIDLAELPFNDFMRRYGSKRKAATGYYQNILTPFLDYLERTITAFEDDNTITQVDFPFLGDEDIEFVTRFKKKYSFYPAFRIILNFIKNHNDRDVKIFRMKHGVGEFSKSHELEEIGAEFDLSRERIRQISVRPFFLEEIREYIEDHVVNAHYKESVGALCFNDSLVFQDISDKEGLAVPFSFFAEIYCYYFDYQYIDKGDRQYIVESKLKKDIERILSHLENLKSAKRPKEVLLPVDSVLEHLPKVSDSEMLLQLVCDVIAPSLGIGVREGLLVLSKNICNVDQEVVEMLELEGKPMHISNILAGLREANPTLALKDTTIKYILQHSGKVRPIGKSSHYALAKWENVSTGSIRDIIRKILSRSDSPVSLQEITKAVLEDYPWTNDKNIYANLSISPEFVLFNGSRFGLASKQYPETYTPSKGLKPHYSIDDRFNQLHAFVNENHRMPCQSGDENEASLGRWIDNALTHKIAISDQNLSRLQRFIEQHRDIPQNGREKLFCSNCHKVMQFVREHNFIPTHKTEPHLAGWFLKNYAIYSEYTDNRRKYFEKLLGALRKLNFAV